MVLFEIYHNNWEVMRLKKSLLSSLLLAGSFLLFNNDASAAELSSTSTSQPSESTDNIVYYDTDKQDILITDEVIIRTIEPSDSKRNTLLDKYSPLNNGVWDLLGYETVYSNSSVWYSLGGDFKVEIEQTDFGPVFYQLKEKDPYIDDNVGQQYHVSGSKYFSLEYRNISSYCDDDDEPGIAEFYMSKLTHTGNGYFMAFYD